MYIVGTSYFRTKQAAIAYYVDYEGNIKDARACVQRLLASGDIHIGRPPLKEDETHTLLDGGKRYGIVSK